MPRPLHESSADGCEACDERGDKSCVTRREFAQSAARSILTLTLFETLCQYDAFGVRRSVLGASGQTLGIDCVRELDAMSRDVKADRIKQTEWQKKAQEVLARVDLRDLLRCVDFEQLRRRVKLKERGARSLRFELRGIDEPERKLAFGRQIFALKKGRSVVPHGHNNMATAFLVLEGELHGRHYDRVVDEDASVLIRPTIDRKFGPGQYSTVSDYRDNVHWFKATSDRAFIFNIHVLGVDPDDNKDTRRVYLDPAGEKVRDGLIRARRINYREAHALYG